MSNNDEPERIRKTGVECPWNFFQILSYLLCIFSILVVTLQIFRSLDFVILMISSVLFSLTLSLVIYYDIKLTVSDPTDPCVKEYLSTKNEE